MSQSRTYLYCRVSTAEQTTENQAQEAAAILGQEFPAHRIVAETISGSIQAALRPGFSKLLERLEPGDMLVCTKPDRLGRNAIDVRQTIDMLQARGVRVKCLALGDTDLTSPAGRMVLQVLSAMAEFERDLIRERTMAGLERTKAAGTQLGRRPKADPKEIDAWRTANAASIAETARHFGVSDTVVKRARAGWDRKAKAAADAR